jgi:hypothetical protein
MRKFIFMFVIFLLVLGLSVESLADINQFKGFWKNQNANTGGITKVKIQVSGTSVTVQAWGKCAPKDCDWGTVTGYAYAPRATANLAQEARAIIAVFKTSFAQSTLIIQVSGNNNLRVINYRRYTDGSNRTNFYATEYFKKSLSMIGGVIGTLMLKPQQLTPTDGTVFSHYPRRTELRWKGVPSAKSYTVEYQYKSGNQWSKSIIKRGITETNYVFSFVGAQPGRWRVWAVLKNGKETAKTGWWEFRYTR